MDFFHIFKIVQVVPNRVKHHKYESAKLRALRANMPCVLTCSRANVSCVLIRAHVSTCLAYLRAHVPSVLTCSLANVPCLSKCSRDINSNKNKFSVACFTKIFGTFSLSFSWEIKLYLKSIYDKQEYLRKHLLWEFNSTFRNFSYEAEAFNRCYDKLCRIKWFDFCLSRTLNIESYL